MTRLARGRAATLLAGRRESGFALALLIVLLAGNMVLNPVRFLPVSWGTEIGLAAPLLAAAVATMPAILGGRGGIDVSVGPLMGFVNAVLVQVFMLDLGVASPWVLVPAAVALGALVGAVNGALATLVRIQP
ncbi:MAG: ABC transporter permease, partial [Pseudomonadota bacterium]|nr:ABC transporter permease [Pseudomonadota bacterium]